MSKTYALITGASSGIGLEIARQLAARRSSPSAEFSFDFCIRFPDGSCRPGFAVFRHGSGTCGIE